MTAIYKREMRAYFTSPSGYIFIAGFLAVSGFLFSLYTVQNAVNGTDADIGGYYSLLIYVMTVFLPILTMKSFSEEKKQKTEQLLLTSPVRLPGMVLAKFLAAYTVFGVTYLITNVYYIIMALYAPDNTLVTTDIAACAIGYGFAILLMGGAFLAIGVFISSLTENQIVAAIASIAVLLILSLLSLIAQGIGFAPLRELLKFFSVYSRFVNFTYGILDYAALLYYFSIMGVFLFLTVRVYEKRRWA